MQLLGFTPAALLDEIVDAIADSDGAALFGVVDTVIDAGLDPERFMKDLLERFRDLVIIAAVEDAFERRLVGGVGRPAVSAAVAGRPDRPGSADPVHRAGGHRASPT